MKLQAPITLTPPPQKQPDGTVRRILPITVHSLDLSIFDSPSHRFVKALIRPCPVPLTVWEGDAYTAAGDYTQAQLEARVMDILGDDPAAVLAGLWPTKTTVDTP